MRKKDFLLPPEQIYMCGHSLGPMSKLAKLQIEKVMQAWSTEAVKAWNTDAWIDLPYQVAATSSSRCIRTGRRPTTRTGACRTT